MPEGYELVQEAELTGRDYNLTHIWKNENGSVIVLYQYLLNSKTNIDTENADIEIFNDIEVAIVTKEKEVSVFWNTNEYAYTVKAIDISKEEVLNIVKSIKY